MTRSFLAVLSLALVAACFESHDGQQAIQKDDCATCHIAQYDATGVADPFLTAPNHQDPEVGFPTTCADCHRSKGWTPALGLHPQPNKYVNSTGGNETFLISEGAHVGIKCQACHDLDIPEDATPPSRGFNTNCIQCHSTDTRDHRNAHDGAVSTRGGAYSTYDTNVPNFCLACHPDGLAKKHPRKAFPISGEGHGSPCKACHDYARGPNDQGENTSCTGCHEHDNEDHHHKPSEVPCYAKFKVAPPTETTRQPPRTLTTVNFCLRCHADGNDKTKLRSSDCP